MPLRFIIDMNLSREWVTVLQAAGWSADHWSTLGDSRADDHQIMEHAGVSNAVVFTFSTILALTFASGPSVVLLRSEDTLPDRMKTVVVDAIDRHEDELAVGALLVVDIRRSRIRMLPLR